MGWRIHGSIPGRGKNFISSKLPDPALGPTQPSVQWILGVVSLGIGWLWREAGG